MDPWTPEDRNEFINEAIYSAERKKGYKGTYHYNVMPKLDSGIEIEDPRRSAVTDVLAETLYQPRFKIIALDFYGLLCHKVMNHPMLGFHMNRDLIIMMKGSNSHMYIKNLWNIIDNEEVFKNTDTDFMICINPFLPKHAFYEIKKQVEIVVKQSLSQYKRTLDYAFFLDKQLDQHTFDPRMIQDFKTEFNNILSTVNVEGAVLHSPFENDEIRNRCSRNSFLITNSKVVDNSVVLVEVPHFERCERIPLRKTPIFCSFNETIDFKRDGHDKKGVFNLYRLKMNVLCKHFGDDGEFIKDERVPADFIDVSIPDIDDVELVYFWTRGRSLNYYDNDVNMWITIPDLETVVAELKRILTEYDCSEQKKVKREAKLAILMKYTNKISA